MTSAGETTMTPKTILVPLSGTEGGDAALAAAFALARAWHGHVVGLHTRMDPRNAIYMASEAVSVQVVDQLIKAAEEDSARREAAAKGQFDAAMAAARAAAPGTPPPSGSFVAEMGTETDVIGGHGRTADLIVAARPKAGRLVERDDLALEAALFDSGRAVLVPAQNPVPTPTETVVVAWNDSPQAARAVAGAMPFLARAGRCTILAATEEADLRPSADRLAANLLHHGVAATVEVLDASAAPAWEALDRRAEALGATLLVMGAYGHSRLREWVLGGVTRHRLGAPGPALLMAH